MDIAMLSVHVDFDAHKIGVAYAGLIMSTKVGQ